VKVSNRGGYDNENGIKHELKQETDKGIKQKNRNQESGNKAVDN
jgi:hypothetical protein